MKQRLHLGSALSSVQSTRTIPGKRIIFNQTLLCNVTARDAKGQSMPKFLSDWQARLHVNVHWFTASEFCDIVGAHVHDALARLNSLPTDMRCENHILEFVEDVIQRAVFRKWWWWGGAFAKDIECSSGNFLLTQRIDQCVLIDDRASCGVDNKRTRLHLVKRS